MTKCQSVIILIKSDLFITLNKLSDEEETDMQVY